MGRQEQRAQSRRAYCSLWLSVVEGSASPETQERVAALEESLATGEILLFRSLAERVLAAAAPDAGVAEKGLSSPIPRSASASELFNSARESFPGLPSVGSDDAFLTPQKEGRWVRSNSGEGSGGRSGRGPGWFGRLLARAPGRRSEGGAGSRGEEGGGLGGASLHKGWGAVSWPADGDGMLRPPGRRVEARLSAVRVILSSGADDSQEVAVLHVTNVSACSDADLAGFTTSSVTAEHFQLFGAGAGPLLAPTMPLRDQPRCVLSLLHEVRPGPHMTPAGSSGGLLRVRAAIAPLLVNAAPDGWVRALRYWDVPPSLLEAAPEAEPPDGGSGSDALELLTTMSIDVNAQGFFLQGPVGGGGGDGGGGGGDDGGDGCDGPLYLELGIESVRITSSPVPPEGESEAAGAHGQVCVRNISLSLSKTAAGEARDMVMPAWSVECSVRSRLSDGTTPPRVEVETDVTTALALVLRTPHLCTLLRQVQSGGGVAAPAALFPGGIIH